MKPFLRKVAVASLCALLGGCGGGSGGTVSLNMVKSAATSGTRDPFFRLDRSLAPAFKGSNTAVQLQSLKYIFGSVQICEGLTTNGSQFSSPTGCIPIYSGPIIGDGSSGSVTPATLATHAAHQIDLMDDTSRARLNGSYTLTSADARSYQWAVVNWYTPIAVKASLTTAGGDIHTKAVLSYDGTTGFGNVPDMSVGGAEEAVVVSPNGGSFFRFQSPFVVSASDITAGTNYAIDMAFNPVGVVAGTLNDQSTAPPMTNFLYNDANDQAMYVPMLSLVPVPRKATDTSKKEIYSIPLLTGRGTTRIELYYAASDTAKTITGVNLITVISQTDTSGSIGQIDNGAKIASVTVEADSSLTLKDNSTPPNTIVSGLQRRANGNVTVNWVGGISVAEPGTAYTFDGTTDVM